MCCPRQSQVVSTGVWAPPCWLRRASHVRNPNLKCLKKSFYPPLSTLMEAKHQPLPVGLGIASHPAQPSPCRVLAPSGTLFLQHFASLLVTRAEGIP